MTECQPLDIAIGIEDKCANQTPELVPESPAVP